MFARIREIRKLDPIRDELAERGVVERLGVNLGLLLLMCSEQPGPAREVLAQYKNARNVPPETLIETGLRASDLVPLGFTEERLRADTLASDEQLSVLGF